MTTSGLPVDRRRELLDTAARVVATDGPAALTVRRLATEAATSTMAVYTWFGSMPDLLAALSREGFERFGRRLREVPRSEEPLVDLLRLGLAYREHALADPHLYAVMFGPQRDPGAGEPGDEAAALATFEILVAAVERAVDDGRLTCSPRDGAFQIWSAVHGTTSLELNGGATGGVWEEVYRSLCTTLLVGLGADPRTVARARDVVARSTNPDSTLTT